MRWQKKPPEVKIKISGDPQFAKRVEKEAPSMFDSSIKSNKFIDAIIRLAAKSKQVETGKPERKTHGKMTVVTKRASTASFRFESLAEQIKKAQIAEKKQKKLDRWNNAESAVKDIVNAQI